MRYLHKDRFVLLFFSLIAMVVLSSFVEGNGAGGWYLGLLLVTSLLLMIFTLLKSRVALVVAILLSMGSLIGYALYLTQGNAVAFMWHVIFSLLLFILCIHSIFQKVIRLHRVTRDTVFASLVVYLLIAIAYAYIYIMIEWFMPGSFAFKEVVASGAQEGYRLMYYSIITLTTVGFGDITPVSHLAHSVTMLESISGVLYLAVLVARLVSAFNQR